MKMKKYSIWIPVLSVSIFVLVCLVVCYWGSYRTGTLKDIDDYNKNFPHKKIPFFATTGELYYAEERSYFHRHDIVIFGELDKNSVSFNGNLLLSSLEDESIDDPRFLEEMEVFPHCTEMIFEYIRYYFDMRLDGDEFYIPLISNYLRGHIKDTSPAFHHTMLVSKKTNKFVLWIYAF